MMPEVSMMSVVVVVVTVAVLWLVGVTAVTMMRIRRVVIQSERLLSKLNDELPELLREMRLTNHNARVMSDQLRDSVEQGSSLLRAVGEVGQTISRVHGVIRGKGTTAVSNLARLLWGMRAAVVTVKDHVNKDKGGYEHETL